MISHQQAEAQMDGRRSTTARMLGELREVLAGLLPERESEPEERTSDPDTDPMGDPRED